MRQSVIWALRAKMGDLRRKPGTMRRLAIGRRYNQRDLIESLDWFARERGESIAFLRSLKSSDWNRTHVHLSIGELGAGDVMVSWAAHDQLHLRQIAKRLFEQTQRQAAGYSVAYAGSR